MTFSLEIMSGLIKFICLVNLNVELMLKFCVNVINKVKIDLQVCNFIYCIMKFMAQGPCSCGYG